MPRDFGCGQVGDAFEAPLISRPLVKNRGETLFLIQQVHIDVYIYIVGLSKKIMRPNM